MTDFTALPLRPPLARALSVLGYTEMTPIQEQSLPALLEGKDVIAQARTGSGKTAAFGLGLLSRLDETRAAVQGLVLCPTRELAEQVGAEVRRLARFVPDVKLLTLTGGVPSRPQTASLQRAPHLVVGTPGRVLDHLRRGNLDLSALRVLVLDEADRMLDMGFSDAILDVVEQTPKARQTLLFSATYPDEIRAMSGRVQTSPVEITIEEPPGAQDIEELFFEVAPEQKLDAVLAILATHRPESALVFCHTRRDTADVASALEGRGVSALALHGDLEQREREEVLVRFANRSASVLVATDVAARGLHIQDLPVVIAWELPIDPDVHTHRIGRTGRAGQKGLALSLCAPNERGRVAALEERRGTQVRWGQLDLSRAKGEAPVSAPMVTLRIDGGRRDKVRPGDILGALTGDVGLPAEAVGKIDIAPTHSFVAVRRAEARRALAELQRGKIKGRSFRVRRLG